MFENIGLGIAEVGPVRIRTNSVKLRIPFGKTTAFPTPLVAYDLPWATTTTERALRIYECLDGLGIAAAGLRSEFTETMDEGDGAILSDKVMPLDLEVPPPPVCPYRPERYGLDLVDILEARIIDIRLYSLRNELGLARYSPEMMRRWDRRAAKMADMDVRAYGGMSAMHWPPDIQSKSNLSKKIQQLKGMNERVLISVSVIANTLNDNMEWLVESGADIVTLMAADWPESKADELAYLVMHTAERLKNFRRQNSAVDPDNDDIKLMVVPPSVISAADVVKLLAMGANLVAIDGWCREFLKVRKQGLSASDWAAANLGVRSDILGKEDEQLEFAPLENRLLLLREILEGLDITDVRELNRRHLIDYVAN